jgi:hypothetical protein
MSKPVVTIQDWAVVQSVISPSYEELLPGKHLMGKVYRTNESVEARLIYTSRILSVDRGEGVVETLNTRYRLGRACEEYRMWESGQDDNQRTINVRQPQLMRYMNLPKEGSGIS